MLKVRENATPLDYIIVFQQQSWRVFYRHQGPLLGYPCFCGGGAQSKPAGEDLHGEILGFLHLAFPGSEGSFLARPPEEESQLGICR